MNDKVFAVVVLYKPIIEEVKLNIMQFIDSIDELLLWDNTPGGLCEEEKRKLLFSPKICYKTQCKNMGVAYALNYAQKSIRGGYLLTMDQDSTWINFSEFLASATQMHDNKIGIYVPQIINQYDSQIDKKCEYSTMIDHAITSGSLIPYSTIAKVGPYREDFFVDGIDVDYSYRVKRAGLYTCRINGTYLKQRPGNMVKRPMFRYLATCYSSDRMYGIIRNHIILYKEYHERAILRTICREYTFKYIIDVILFQSHKIEKIRSIVKGIKDGLSHKT